MEAKEIANKINKLFKCEKDKHPVAFVREGEDHCTVSAESGTLVADYYEDFIHPDLQKFMKEIGHFLEWENPGCLGVYEE